MPGGASLIPGEPLTASRLSSNISAACKACGFPDIVLYDARKDAANDFERKLGSHAASLVLGHKEVATVATEFYSLGVGNFDVIGVRTGEASHQFSKGYKNRLNMRIRNGTALCYVSKAIALAGQSQLDEDDEDNNEKEQVDRALELVQQTREDIIKAAVEKALQESQKVREHQESVNECWDAWVQTFELGSDLYMLFKANSVVRIQTNVSEIKKWPLYQKAEKDEAFKTKAETAEKRLRDAYTALAAEKKEISRKTTRAVKKSLDNAQTEAHPDTYEDKDRAVEYLKQPSSLVTSALKVAEMSAPHLDPPAPSEEPAPEADPAPLLGDEDVRAFGKEEDNLIAEDAIDEYKQVLNYLPENFTNGSGSKIQEILDDAQKDIDIQANADIPDEQPEQSWGDDHEEEEYTDALLVDTKIAIIKSVMDPYLFELECKAKSNKGDGKLTCYKCPEDAPPRNYVQFTKLKSHLAQHHTEWTELSAKMKRGNKFVCPGICRSKEFDSEAEARAHCLSDECQEQEAFLLFKSRHDVAQAEKYAAQNKYKAEVPARYRRELYQKQLEYFGSLDEDDLLELADLHGIPREEMSPYIPAMLKNFHFVAEMLLNTGEDDDE